MSDYQQHQTVLRFHRLPRFGNSPDISVLASSDEEQKSEYLHGVIGFSIFLSLLCILWATLLVVLKLRFDLEQLGCAVGGGAVDIPELRLNRLSRRRRKERVLRAWRLQTVFFVCCLLIPMLSFLLINQGFHPVIFSLGQIDAINQDVDALALQGLEVANSFGEQCDKMRSINFNSSQICPQYNFSLFLQESGQREIQYHMNDLFAFEQNYIHHFKGGLDDIMKATSYLDDSINKTYHFDWILKSFLLALNILNLSLLVGVLLTKNGINSVHYQCALSYVGMPLFCFLLFGSMIGTCIFLIGATANADFCSGGVYPGSPYRTLQNMILERGYNESSLVFESLDYFSNNCSQGYPFQFFIDIENVTAQSVNQLNEHIQSIATLNISELSDQCGSYASTLNSMLNELLSSFQVIDHSLTDAVDILACTNFQPVFETIYYGSPCTDSIEGLAWLFSTMIAITIIGLTMITIRAALYNVVIPSSRHRRREKEFEDYKSFMAKFYDVTEWKLDPDKNDIPGVPHVQTSETEKSSGSFDESFSPQKISEDDDCSKSDDDSSYSYDSEDDSERFSAEESGVGSTLSLLVDRWFHFGTKKHDDSENDAAILCLNREIEQSCDDQTNVNDILCNSSREEGRDDQITHQKLNAGFVKRIGRLISTPSRVKSVSVKELITDGLGDYPDDESRTDNRAMLNLPSEPDRPSKLFRTIARTTGASKYDIN